MRRFGAHEISIRHVEAVRETAAKFRLRFGETRIDQITAGDVKEWLSDLPLAVKTRNRHLGYVSTMFQLASEQADHSETVLKKHYREVVTKDAAEQYFQILV
jgi:hypothetical protein